MVSGCPKRCLDWVLGNEFFTEGVVRIWNSSGITIPENIQNTCGCGTCGWGLVVNTEVLG